MIRSTILRLTRTDAARRAVRALERVLPADPHRLTVLTYHRIAESGAPTDLYPGLVSAEVDRFAEQMAYLAARHHPLSAGELLDVRRGAPLPPRSVVVTFDDAYRDFADLAVPVLRRHGIPALLFVPTAYPDRPDSDFWWDRLWLALQRMTLPAVVEGPTGRVTIASVAQLHPAFRRLARDLKAMPHTDALAWLDHLRPQLPDAGSCHAVLGWDALRDLAADGVAVAPHSRTHPRLDRVSADALTDEIDGSWADIRRELGSSVPPIFAYPDGAHDDDVVDAVRRAGLEIAFTTRRGTNDTRRIDWLRVRRINVGSHASLALIQAQLLVPRWPARSARPRSAT